MKPTTASVIDSESDHTQLKDCALFAPLSQDDLRLIWNSGTTKTFPAETQIHPPTDQLGFLNVLLQGEGQITRKVSNDEEEFELEAGSVFGPIDSILGGYRFHELTFTSDVLVFSVEGEKLASLFRAIPELHAHISKLRSSIATNSAEEYQKRLEMHANLENQGPRKDGSVRVAPRLSVWERNLTVTLDNGKVCRIDNVSVSGMGVVGQSPTPVGDSISFVFEGSSLDMSPIFLSGKVTRINKDSFGVQLIHLNSEIKELWEEVIFKVISAEVADPFDPQLIQLEEPLDVHFETRGFIHQAEIVSLGPSGAILKSLEPLISNSLKLTLSLAKDETQSSAFQLDCRVVSREERGYLLEFRDTSPPNVRTLETFLGLKPAPSPAERTSTSDLDSIIELLPSPESDSVSEDQNHQAEIAQEERNCWPTNLKLRKRDELFKKYFEEMENGELIVGTPKDSKVGDHVEVTIETVEPSSQVTTKIKTFVILGAIEAIDGKNAKLKLSHDSHDTLTLLQKLIEAHAFFQMQDEYHRKRKSRWKFSLS